MIETNRIEFKRNLTDDLEQEVVAFLNYREGGRIYVGISDDGSAIGVPDFDAVQLTIKNRLRDKILPSCLGLFDVIHEVHEGKDIILINIASGPDKPYYLKKHGMSEKGCFMRVGSAAEPMNVRQIEDLFAKRTRHSLSKITSNRQGLTFEQLKIYYEAKKLKLTDKFPQNLELVTKEGEFNYVAYLLADENGTSIKVAKYAGTDRVDLIESNEYGYCSLIKATKAVLDKLELENKTATKITSKERIDTRLWDAIALREAVINAIIHNDYTREVPPKFEIFTDRLEITSYGGLFEGMTQDDFFDGLSLPRNKELMRVYKDLEMVEQLGSGVPRILQAYSKDCFKFSENFVRMVFPSSDVMSDQVRALDGIGDDEKAGGRVGGQTGGQIRLEELRNDFGTLEERTAIEATKNIGFLDENHTLFLKCLQDDYGISSEKLQAWFRKSSGRLQESFRKASGKLLPNWVFILELILIYPNINAEDISKIIGVSKRTIYKNFNDLQGKGLIERIGGRKEGYWQIKKQD